MMRARRDYLDRAILPGDAEGRRSDAARRSKGQGVSRGEVRDDEAAATKKPRSQ